MISSDKGFIVGLMGNSGSGKSTILKLILGIEKKYKGDILIFPENPVISCVPQEPVLFEHLSLLENAEYFKRVNNYRTHFKQDQFDKLADILQVKNILHYSKSINEISGGQKQRISLLRALSIQPDVLLLDEPLTGLDEEVKDVFLQTITKLVDSLNLLIINVTHHRKEVEFISNEILYLTREHDSLVVGEVSLSKTDAFFNDPPTMSALNAIKDVSTNVVHINRTDNRISLLDENGSEGIDGWCHMAFKEDVICFGNDYGYEYEIVHNTRIYSLVRLVKSGVVICIRSEKMVDSRYIFFVGSVKIYNNKGAFVSNTEVNNDNLLYLNNERTKFIFNHRCKLFFRKGFCKKKLSDDENNRVFLTSRRKIEFDEENSLDNIVAKENVYYLPNIDLTVEEDIDLLCTDIEHFFSGRFHVINCLGFFAQYEMIEQMNINIARKIFEGNILALYAVAHKIIPLMCARGGHFVGFSTHTAYQNYPLMAAFTAAKVAVESLIKSISNEYLSEGIVANAIAPATLKTKVEFEMKPNGDHENWLELSDVCNLVEGLILYSNNIINGTVIQAYKYSDTYFKQAYYDRVNANKE